MLWNCNICTVLILVITFIPAPRNPPDDLSWYIASVDASALWHTHGMANRMLRRIVIGFALLLLTIIAIRQVIIKLLVAAYYRRRGDVDHICAEHQLRNATTALQPCWRNDRH